MTLYRVGAVKRLPRERTWVAVDGGMSDNPRPQLYDARYTALSAERADEAADEVVSVAGMHCESGDVLIDDVALPAPRRGDLLAVPATGAVHARDGVELQRRPPPGRGARPRRAGDRDSHARDRRRPVADRLVHEFPLRGVRADILDSSTRYSLSKAADDPEAVRFYEIDGPTTRPPGSALWYQVDTAQLNYFVGGRTDS